MGGRVCVVSSGRKWKRAEVAANEAEKLLSSPQVAIALHITRTRGRQCVMPHQLTNNGPAPHRICNPKPQRKKGTMAWP